jgi:HK97 family phage major capsid protein
MLKELREKMMRIATNARSKISEINADTTAERAAEIEREYDAMMADYDQLDSRCKRLERLEEVEARANQRDPRAPRGENTDHRAQDDQTAITYRDAFYQMLRAGGEVSEMPQEYRAALRGGVDASPEVRAQLTGTGSAGGFTVPTELSTLITRVMMAWGPMYDASVIQELVTSSGNPIDLPVVNDTASTAVAHTEGAALVDDGSKDVTFSKPTLNSYVFDTRFIKWSIELAQDSIVNMETFLADILGERLARIANSQLTTGTGSSAPNGVATASALGKTAASTTAIVADEIIDLLHQVDPAYRQSPKAAFMMNDSTMAAIRKLKDGQGNYLWQMGDVTKGVPPSLLGYKLHINQAMASIATGNRVILFGDFGKYIVRKVGQPVIGVMRERFWPDLGIAGLIRFDGELPDTSAIKHYKMA